MSSAIVMDKNFQESSRVELPEKFLDINPHNYYLYVKSYRAALRANSAFAKTRGLVSGTGKKPWSQKGGGRARAGSMTSPVMVGGGKAHGATNNRNYDLKVNKKQIRLAFKYALEEKAREGKLFLVDDIKIESGKTKDAFAFFNSFNQKDVLFATSEVDEKSFLAFRNLPKAYLVDMYELNPYLIGVFKAVVMQKALFDKITKEG